MSVLMQHSGARVMFWSVGGWVGVARERGNGVESGVVGWGSCQGGPSHAEGLSLQADRWPVDLSPQFVLPRSPGSSHISHPPQSGSDSGF